jgi:hypothetical protein
MKLLKYLKRFFTRMEPRPIKRRIVSVKAWEPVACSTV